VAPAPGGGYWSGGGAQTTAVVHEATWWCLVVLVVGRTTTSRWRPAAVSMVTRASILNRVDLALGVVGDAGLGGPRSGGRLGSG